MKARIASLALGGLLTFAFTPSPVHAQDDEEFEEESFGDEEESADEESADEAEKSTEEEGEGEGGKEGDIGAEPELAGTGDSPVELPGKTYQFVGFRYRGIIVPKFMMNLFGDGGTTVYIHSFGPEFAIRRDGFEYQFALWFANYAMGPTPFKAKDDPVEGWEIVESKLKIIYLTADFLWSNEISPEFAINYGMGAGLGIVFGDLPRWQAYPVGPESDPDSYVKCNGPNNPNPRFCDTDEDRQHYGDSEESWAGGGSKPIVFPWFAIQTGLRYKPAKEFVGRLDLGFGLSGFFIGIGADYGLP